MRDVDDDFLRDAAPPAGSAARAEVWTERSFDERLTEGTAKAELLEVQKYARGEAKPSPSRGASILKTAAKCSKLLQRRCTLLLGNITTRFLA